MLTGDPKEAENPVGRSTEDITFDEEKVYHYMIFPYVPIEKVIYAFFSEKDVIYIVFVCIDIAFFMQVKQLKELSKLPDIYDRLTRSLAPNIWELDDVKKGLLCQVIPYFDSPMLDY